jgi:predicted nucleic acid-binding protein
MATPGSWTALSTAMASKSYHLMSGSRAAATKVLLKQDLPANAIDCAIGAFAASRDMPLITCNKKRFSWLKEVYTPEELMKKLG